MKRMIILAAVIAAAAALSACAGSDSGVSSAETTAASEAAAETTAAEKPKETKAPETEAETETETETESEKEKSEPEEEEAEEDVTQHKFMTYNGNITYETLKERDLAYEADGILYAFVCKNEPKDGRSKYKVYICKDGKKWEKTDQSFTEYGDDVNVFDGALLWRLALDDTHLLSLYTNTSYEDDSPKAAMITLDGGKVTYKELDGIFDGFTSYEGAPLSEVGTIQAIGTYEDEGKLCIYFASEIDGFDVKVDFDASTGTVRFS